LVGRLVGEPDRLTPAFRPDAGPPEWHLPDIAQILQENIEQELSQAEIRQKVRTIEETLASFGVPAKVVEVNQGPTITQFGVEPGYVERRDPNGQVHQVKVKVGRIAALGNDLALALAAAPIRIEAPVPGRNVIGIEVPNREVALVALRSVMESETFKKFEGKLKLALGQDVSGNAIVADLTAMPHLLIAGATGSGKSVCINSIIACLLCTHTPQDLRLVMIDPKMVELTNFNGLPHLIAPVVVDIERVVGTLTWATREMDRRYRLFSEAGTRNIEAYNATIASSLASPHNASSTMEQSAHPVVTAGDHDTSSTMDKPQSIVRARDIQREPLPYIVIFIDELADLMMIAPEEVERLVCRIAQLARATGIHLVMATQRPSVDVVTGLIKANFPARISFAVTSQIDSRVILDSVGAESLLGAGDMLYMASDSSKLVRIQGCFVSDEEIRQVVEFWRAKAEPDWLEAQPPWEELMEAEEKDELLGEAIKLVKEYNRASASFLQRKLRIGYPRASRLMDQLEERGIIGSLEDDGRSREVLVSAPDEVSAEDIEVD
jgi:S-DNA-T family DNA segregation ATPase FtsK/SpoIIIE